MANADERVVLSGAQAALISWLLAGMVNAAAITSYALTIPKGGQWYLGHYLYDAGHFWALGLLSASLVDAYRRWGPKRRWWSPVVLTAAALALGSVTLAEDLFNMSQRLSELLDPDLLLVLSVTAVALGIPAAHVVGGWLARPRRRWLGVAGGLAAQAINPLILKNDYPAAHLYVALAGVTLAASSLAGAALPKRLRPLWLQRPAVRYPAIGALSLAAAWSVVVPPPNAIAVQLLRCDGSVLPPYLGQLQAPLRSGDASELQIQVDDWFRDRTRAAPVPPTVISKQLPIVLLLGIDALRADVALDGKHDEMLPAIARMRAESISFTEARAPGSQTVYTMSSLFSGTYFSQQYWSPAMLRRSRQLWPHEDPTVRFPALLGRANIPTVNYTGAEWMRNRWGVVAGFSNEHWITDTIKILYTRAEVVGDALLERIKRLKEGPIFLFTHFLDPHAPYNLSKVRGSAFERYLGEVALVDRQLDRVLQLLDERPELKRRTVVIVMSDHGEAFDEHNTTSHAKTLYEELIRVPLFIRYPGAPPRQVAEPISLMDLGPTVLDLFGLETPPHFMGQSLVPFLHGQDRKLTRPIVAEGRLKRAMVLPDGLKIILDDRNRTPEIYDLKQDPGELRNLADDPQLSARPKAMLERFFKAHRIKREGYKIPYRP